MSDSVVPLVAVVQPVAPETAAPVIDYAQPQQPSLKQLAKSAALWSFVGYSGSVGLRLVSNMVLTRLLFPGAYALMGLASIFINGLQMLTDVGVQTGIIQSKQGDDQAYLNTAWTVQVVRGFALCLIAVALGWPIARLYHEPSLIWLLPAI